MDSHSDVRLQGGSGAIGVQRESTTSRLNCRVVYLQATSEEPRSMPDHWEHEAEGCLKLYQTSSW